MEINKDELNKKLAEWAGFEYSHSARRKNFFTGEYGRMDKFWVHPEGYVSSLPNFTKSLDACFKWLIPELTKRIGWSRTKSLLQKWIGYAEFDYEKDVLALCLVVEKLIDSAQ